ncbi:MAG: hypothetical protein K1X57_13050 [Gemmataceae bacterium]|nr:hypothetical protein [Gemmataceae bacterium]
MRGLWAILVVLVAVPARAEAPSANVASPSRALLTVPMDAIPQVFREKVQKVTQQPAIVARAVPEEFTEGIYDWLLDHPDRASLAWRRLGIPCAEIAPRPQGRFGWSDGQGTEVNWQVVGKTDTCRVWYAEGQARVSPLMPLVPVKAVVVLHHAKAAGLDGRKRVAHVCDVYLHTDSKAAAMTARMLGPAMPRLAQQGADQLLLFFSGLTRYFEDHPEDIESLLAARRQ